MASAKQDRMEIKAIIFDLGKVIFDLSFDRVFQSWATSSGLSFDEIKNRFEFDDHFISFEKNEISPKKFRENVSKKLNFKLSDEDFDRGWCDVYLAKYKDIDNLLIRTKSKYKSVALTNTNAIHNNVWQMKYADTLSHFEKIFSSHEIGTRKPEEKSFKTVLDYLQCRPDEALFLDDTVENINGAKRLGIATILVASNEQMKTELKHFGIIE